MYSAICALCEPLDGIVVESIEVDHIASNEESAASIGHDSFYATFRFRTLWKMRQRSETQRDGELLILGVPPYGAAGSRVHAGLQVIDEHFARYAAEILKRTTMTIKPG